MSEYSSRRSGAAHPAQAVPHDVSALFLHPSPAPLPHVYTHTHAHSFASLSLSIHTYIYLVLAISLGNSRPLARTLPYTSLNDLTNDAHCMGIGLFCSFQSQNFECGSRATISNGYKERASLIEKEKRKQRAFLIKMDFFEKRITIFPTMFELLKYFVSSN